MSDEHMQMVDQMKEAAGFLPAKDCTPCNISGAVAVLVELTDTGNEAIDVTPLVENVPADRSPREWMTEIEGVVAACDREKGDCETPEILVEALKQSVDVDEINALSDEVEAARVQ